MSKEIEIFRIKKSFLIIVILLIIPLGIKAQQGIIHGQVVAFDTIPITKAQINIKKSEIMVLSDSLGSFSIECNIGDKIAIKAAGFKTKQVKIKNHNDSLFVNLKFQGGEDDIEAAVANGHINRQRLVYTTDYLDADYFDTSGYMTVIELITGKFPGVNQVGDKIIIRGINSLEGNNEAAFALNGMITTRSSVESLSVNDIKNIKVLKGTEAARYGSRGANGVIMITTK